jgi:hypothetical protein
MKADDAFPEDLNPFLGRGTAAPHIDQSRLGKTFAAEQAGIATAAGSASGIRIVATVRQAKIHA